MPDGDKRAPLDGSAPDVAPRFPPHRRRRSSQIRRDIQEDTRSFDNFRTIDWVADTVFERARRQHEAARGRGKGTFHGWMLAVANACQSWFVVSLAGAAIGVNAALISIITEWGSDFKMGRCATGWWLNRKFCCWGLDTEGEAGCEDWLPWTQWSGIQYMSYTFYAVVFAAMAGFLVRSYAPYAAGSGISEIKCLLSGFTLDGYLDLPVLLIKSVALPLTIASGLSVGKEGPSVHVACCIGNVVARSFERFRRSHSKMREIVTAASAAGVAVAFGSPIGGVLFSLEEMTINFPIKTMLRSFFCALVATMTLSAMNPFRTGKLVLFQVSYDRDWHFFEVGFFILIGVFGGLYGAFVIKYNFQVQSFRRKHLSAYGLWEVVILALLTALIGYPNRFLRIDMTQSLDILFRECEGGGDYDGLCQTWAQWRMINSLLLATVLRTCLVILSYGCKVPAGIFVPSMAIGATFGRMIGILVKALYRAYPHAALFATCEPEKPCITPGTYALLGAAAALSGIMRITVTVVVIMFELTGALTYILPTMIVVMVTKAVSDFFAGGKGGIADQAIRFNGYPALDKEEQTFNLTVGDVMKRSVVALPASGMTLDQLESRLNASPFSGFPIVSSGTHNLLGYVLRDDLVHAIARARHHDIIEPDAPCLLVTESVSTEVVSEYNEEPTRSIDLGEQVNKTPLTVSSVQSLEMVMQLFKKMGPRLILVEDHGELVGLLTLKDALRQVATLESYLASDHQEFERILEDVDLFVREKAARLFRMMSGRPQSPLQLRMDDNGVHGS